VAQKGTGDPRTQLVQFPDMVQLGIWEGEVEKGEVEQRREIGRTEEERQ